MIMIYFSGFCAGLFLLIRKKTDPKSAAVVIAGSLLAVLLQAMGSFGKDGLALSEIQREGKAGSEKTVELEAEADGEKTTLQIQIAPQEYGEEELQELCQRLWHELEKEIPAGNASMDYVTEDLYFPETVEGYPFLLKWETSDSKLLTADGQIGEDIPEEGALTEIRLRISKEGSSFEEEHIFYAQLFLFREKAAFWKRLENTLAGMEKATRDSGSYILPGSFEGKEVTFYRQRQNKSGPVFLLSVIGAVAVSAVRKQEAEKREKERLEEISREYPGMVSHITMLVGAGMSISGAFKRLAGEYGGRKQERAKPLYEALLIACREIESGISEETAYRNMGTRCRLPCVVRLTALLAQYHKSGASGLKKALREETDQALKERKEQAIRLGEEAGTKLLLPMTFMLVLVMIIIMVPAFTSFGI